MSNTQKYIIATKALASFERGIKSMHESKTSSPDVLRDSLILRFTLASDAFWKCVQEYLEAQDDIDLELYGPNKILLACDDFSLIADEDYLLFVCMIQDRLVAPLGLDEELAESVAGRIPGYFPAMKAVLEKIKL